MKIFFFIFYLIYSYSNTYGGNEWCDKFPNAGKCKEEEKYKKPVKFKSEWCNLYPEFCIKKIIDQKISIKNFGNNDSSWCEMYPNMGNCKKAKFIKIENKNINKDQKKERLPNNKIKTQKKNQTIIIPAGSLGVISEVRKNMLEKTLESALDDHFDIVPKDLFEEAQERAFEELDYEECTEEQCIMMIKEILQVENSFQLILMEEDGDTQISLTWNDLYKKRVEVDFCEECKTKELMKSVDELVETLVGLRKN